MKNNEFAIMQANKKELILKFNAIKDHGWIPTQQKGDQRLGQTFENLLGKQADNKAIADYQGIELKTQRQTTDSFVTLFSKAPSFPKRANTLLREQYGSIRDGEKYPVLNTTIAANKPNTHRNGYNFQLNVDRKAKKIYISVKEQKTNNLLENNIFWNFSDLEIHIDQKLNNIAMIFGEEKKEGEQYFVKYNRLVFLDSLNLEKVLIAIENGDLFADVRIGVYKSGKNSGKTHDHGTGFRIKYNKLLNYVQSKEVSIEQELEALWQ